MMFEKDSWEVNDTLVVNGKHGTITRFSADLKKVYVEHKDNENHPYERWYTPEELPPYRSSAGEKFLPAAIEKETPPPAPYPASGEGEKEKMAVQELPIVQAPESLKRGAVLKHKSLNYQRIVAKVDGLTLEFGLGCGKGQWDSSVWEIVPPDEDAIAAMLNGSDAQYARIAELETRNKEKDARLASQSTTIAELMKADDKGLQAKIEQLEAERDDLKRVNEKQSEMLKAAAAVTVAPSLSTVINPQATIDSLRAEVTVLHRELDKALKSPHDALELRLAKMEEKLTEATDFIEGVVERSMDEAEIAAEKRVLELNQPELSHAPLLLTLAKALAMAAGDTALKAVG